MLAELSWLPAVPDDHRQLVRTLKADMSSPADPAALWNRLKGLAAYSLDETQLSQLAHLSAQLPDSANVPSRLALAIVGDGTLSLLGPAVAASALRRDLRVQVIETDYGAAAEQAMNPDSTVHQVKPDFVLLASDYRMLGLNRCRAEGDARVCVENALTHIRSIVEGLRPSVKRAIIVQTIVPPTDPLFGSFDLMSDSSPYAQVNALNARLAAWVSSESGLALADAARLAASVGLERWEDHQHWHSSKLPFSPDVIPLYGDFIARILGALLGKSRKCLVLDLDNTLWGGVIGDDGVGGIALGQGSATGEAFLAIQNMALDLRSRGVVLAVCSKNEPDAARIPFREHSEMVLKEDHIAVFQANWIDKAANLKLIAETLNIGIDALVFLDDNPAEREQVRRELPMVAVPELPASPALYPRALMAAGYFDAVSFGEEDRKRAEFYQANAGLALSQLSASDMAEYLKSLDMVCKIRRFNAEGRARISQLINKSNQFNLTTRRYTEQEVAAIETDAGKYHVQVQLVDRFGNNGMISVVIADKAADAWTIDTWLMSCRVLNRRVEEAILANLAHAARAAGAKRVIGHYIPSAKNRIVAEHYGKLGFQHTDSLPAGGTVWELDLAKYEASDLPMRVETDLPAASRTRELVGA